MMLEKAEWKTYMTGVLDQAAMYISKDCTAWDLTAISMAIAYLGQAAILTQTVDETPEDRLDLADIFEAQAMILIDEMVDGSKFDGRLFDPTMWSIDEGDG